MALKVQMPAKNPAMVPQPISVFVTQSAGHVAGGSVRNIPRLTAISREKINVHPNTFPLFPRFTSSSVKLLSFIHAFPNNPGEYQMPPTTKEEIPATKTASQLIDPTCIILSLI